MYEINKVFVIGAGAMGPGIAGELAQTGETKARIRYMPEYGSALRN